MEKVLDQLKVSDENSTVSDKRKQAAGVSPNQVHVLHAFIYSRHCTAFAEGIKDFAMVQLLLWNIIADVERLANVVEQPLLISTRATMQRMGF